MTAQNILNKTLGLMGKRSRDGSLDTTKTARYSGAAVDILNTFLMENKVYTYATDTQTYTEADQDANGDIIYTLPANTALIEDLTLTPKTLYTVTPDSIIIPKFVGEMVIRTHTYITISTLADSINDIYVTAASYFLAAHLLLQEDSPSADYFNQKYTEAKRSMHRPRTSQVRDMY